MNATMNPLTAPTPKAGQMTSIADSMPLPLDAEAIAKANPESRVESRMARDKAFEHETILLAAKVPDARGLEEIRDPFLKAKVADALDVGRDPGAMRKLGRILSMRYPAAADRVLKQADYLARTARF
jgi:hypothetical protein